jgi:hypothetical protein
MIDVIPDPECRRKITTETYPCIMVQTPDDVLVAVPTWRRHKERRSVVPAVVALFSLTVVQEHDVASVCRE